MKEIVKKLQTIILASFLMLSLGGSAQTIEDGFEGNGNINSWWATDCVINTNLPNPVPQGINTSATVMEYFDYGGLWGNALFEVENNLNIGDHPEFSLKIFVPSGSLTGNQDNVVTLKLQNSKVLDPWQSQTAITKPIALDQWQEVQFNFSSDDYVNLNPNSPPPATRTDFDRVLIQVNGENNNDLVTAYIDDFYHFSNTPLPEPEVYDQLIWSDEFNTDGPLDDSKWHHQTLFPMGNSWFSGEIQHYTDRLDNSYIEDGKLHILAKQESYTDQGVTKNYTSARINSKFAFTYGRVEVRAKLPSGAGTWPAIWMLGKNINENGAWWQTQGFGEVPWPACGEMDIMEHWGHNPNRVTSAFHAPSTYPVGEWIINAGGRGIPTATTEFHTYALEWTEDKLEFSADGVVHYIYQPPVKNADTWPFDADHYLIMNLAILPSIDPSFTEGALEVDYIRVYQKSPLNTSEKDARGNILVFPNPVDNQVSFQLNQALNGTVTFEVYNMIGSLVHAEEVHVSDGRAQLRNLGALPKGVYIIASANAGLTETVKFVK